MGDGRARNGQQTPIAARLALPSVSDDSRGRQHDERAGRDGDHRGGAGRAVDEPLPDRPRAPPRGARPRGRRPQLEDPAVGLVHAAEPQLADPTARSRLRGIGPRRLHDRRAGRSVLRGLRAVLRRARAVGGDGPPDRAQRAGVGPEHDSRTDLRPGRRRRHRRPGPSAYPPVGGRPAPPGGAAAHERLPQPPAVAAGKRPRGGRGSVGSADRLGAGPERSAGAHRGRPAPVPAAALPRAGHLLVDGPARDAGPHTGLAARRTAGADAQRRAGRRTRDLDVRRLVAEGVTAHGRLLALRGYPTGLRRRPARDARRGRGQRPPVPLRRWTSTSPEPVSRLPSRPCAEPGRAPWITEGPARGWTSAEDRHGGLGDRLPPRVALGGRPTCSTSTANRCSERGVTAADGL